MRASSKFAFRSTGCAPASAPLEILRIHVRRGRGSLRYSMKARLVVDAARAVVLEPLEKDVRLERIERRPELLRVSPRRGPATPRAPRDRTPRPHPRPGASLRSRAKTNAWLVGSGGMRFASASSCSGSSGVRGSQTRRNRGSPSSANPPRSSPPAPAHPAASVLPAAHAAAADAAASYPRTSPSSADPLPADSDHHRLQRLLPKNLPRDPRLIERRGQIRLLVAHLLLRD